MLITQNLKVIFVEIFWQNINKIHYHLDYWNTPEHDAKKKLGQKMVDFFYKSDTVKNA